MSISFQDICNILSENGLSKDIYKAINEDDMSEILLKFVDVIKSISFNPLKPKEFKCEDQSNLLRKTGNEAFKKKKYNDALKLYNQALSKAPVYSRAMKLAYSNRSALLHKTEHFDAALKDIKKCFSLGCPDDIADKLQERKLDCLNRLQEKNTQVDEFVDNFFSFNVECNPDIPCASAMLGVIIEEQFPKVVSVEDVLPGTVLAIEPSFVSAVNYRYNDVSCYYCQRMSLNLEPCHRCTFALFCSMECYDKCFKDYHSVECELTPLFQQFCENDNRTVFMKIVIKIRGQFDSWEEFILATNGIGMNKARYCERIKKCSINEIYDGNNKYSALLWYKDTTNMFNCGLIYNSAMFFAPILNYLISNSNFFPKKEPQRLRSIRAVCRLLMYFTVSNPNVLAKQVPGDDILLLNNRSGVVTGYYPLACKLTSSCKPNVCLVLLNGKIAIVATSPIKKGTELTYCGLPWMETTNSIKRVVCLYRVFKILCRCQICVENWNLTTAPMILSDLSDKQKRYISIVNFIEIEYNLSKRIAVKTSFEKICDGLTVFENMPYRMPYVRIHLLFIRFIELFRTMQ